MVWEIYLERENKYRKYYQLINLGKQYIALHCTIFSKYLKYIKTEYVKVGEERYHYWDTTFRKDKFRTNPRWFKRLELTKNQSLSACKQLASPQSLKTNKPNQTSQPASNSRVSWTVLTIWSRRILSLNKSPRIPKRQILSGPHLWVIYSCIN